MFTSMGVALLVVGILFPVLGTVAVVLRFWARIVITKSGLGLDDYTIALGLIFTYMQNFAVTYGVYNSNFGLPQEEISGQTTIAYGKTLFAETILWQLATATIKVSILLLYQKIFVMRELRIITRVLMAAIVAWMIINIFCTIFSWTPVEGHWTRMGYTNFNFPAFLISTGVLTIVFDIVVLSIPVVVVRRLHMSSRRKVVMTGMFLLGTLCVIASMVRLPYRILYLQGVGLLSGGEHDAFHLDVIPKVVLWALLESDIAIIAACLPTYGPLLNERALDSVVRSAQSVVSLRSRITGRDRDNDRGPIKELNTVLTRPVQEVKVIDRSAVESIHSQMDLDESARSPG